NQWGQLGDGSTVDRSLPVDVVGLTSGVVAVSAGDSHTCALTSIGGVKCWGRNNDGQLGDGTTPNRLTRNSVTGLGSGISGIDAGGFHACALSSAGAVLCWGSNSNGQIGDGTTMDRAAPVTPIGLSSGVKAIGTG